MICDFKYVYVGIMFNTKNKESSEEHAMLPVR